MSAKRKRRRGSSGFVRGLSALAKRTGQGIAAAARAVGRGIRFILRLIGRALSAVGHLLRRLRRLIALFLLVGLCGGTLALTVSGVIVRQMQTYILTPEAVAEAAGEQAFDCVLILGAGLRDDGSPSDMLHDRVITGVDLWLTDPSHFGALLMSGDHTGDYNEPAAMKQLAVSRGADSSRVFLDHEGYSTYESMVRARDVFGAGRVLIITQNYHLYRALYIARSLGLDAYGVSADTRRYRKETYREAREVLARYKDFWATARDVPPLTVPSPVDLDSDGDQT